ncbi:hypothetical protein BDN72DRAFT_540446 [Pluteus cervinus]|uniref:Uncharacterized protein n=1 Tax=Pluteus cervinus TaxID=181527 RepID=A0ACD3AXG9_9AGAR|nr:hypothetical protein BDN72DRAFT_540446 [Pluteus cervinus]
MQHAPLSSAPHIPLLYTPLFLHDMFYPIHMFLVQVQRIYRLSPYHQPFTTHCYIFIDIHITPPSIHHALHTYFSQVIFLFAFRSCSFSPPIVIWPFFDISLFYLFSTLCRFVMY